MMALTPEQITNLPKEIRDLIDAATQMPRITPLPGCASSIYNYRISAGAVWTLDNALKDLGVPTYPLARPEDAGRPAPRFKKGDKIRIPSLPGIIFMAYDVRWNESGFWEVCPDEGDDYSNEAEFEKVEN